MFHTPVTMSDVEMARRPKPHDRGLLVGRRGPGGAARGQQVPDRRAGHVDDERLDVRQVRQGAGEREGVEPQPEHHEQEQAERRGRGDPAQHRPHVGPGRMREVRQRPAQQADGEPETDDDLSSRTHVNLGFGGAAGSGPSGGSAVEVRHASTSVEDVMGQPRPGRARRVDVPLTPEDEVEQRTRYAQEGGQRAVGPPSAEACEA